MDLVGNNRDTRGDYSDSVDRRVDDAKVTEKIDSGFRMVDGALTSLGKLLGAVDATSEKMKEARDVVADTRDELRAAPSSGTTIAPVAWKWDEIIDSETGAKSWLVSDGKGGRAECNTYELAVQVAALLNMKAQADHVRNGRTPAPIHPVSQSGRGIYARGAYR